MRLANVECLACVLQMWKASQAGARLGPMPRAAPASAPPSDLPHKLIHTFLHQGQRRTVLAH
eukprot:356730-Chlamydomonas_euryale.AAC.2